MEKLMVEALVTPTPSLYYPHPDMTETINDKTGMKHFLTS